MFFWCYNYFLGFVLVTELTFIPSRPLKYVYVNQVGPFWFLRRSTQVAITTLIWQVYGCDMEFGSSYRDKI